MTIDDALITYLEGLSCLAFSEGEKARLKGELGKILTYMARLSEFGAQGGLEGEGETEGEGEGRLREDAPSPSFPRDLILKNAPRENGEAFVAPQTVE